MEGSRVILLQVLPSLLESVVSRAPGFSAAPCLEINYRGHGEQSSGVGNVDLNFSISTVLTDTEEGRDMCQSPQ